MAGGCLFDAIVQLRREFRSVSDLRNCTPRRPSTRPCGSGYGTRRPNASRRSNRLPSGEGSHSVRFNLRELFAVVFVCAFACMAFVRCNAIVGAIFYSFTLCVMLAAILLAIVRQGDRRYFWIGFAVAGVGY